ncbi:MAG: hypothetical protein LUQ65_05665 [Candidatus Helarchaeota archaeon]|nr:hypothetical protein [Candidatus Helarchaeota archaeon]
MAELKFIDARTILFADLNLFNIEVSIRSAIKFYAEAYGVPKRVWVNAKDVPDEIQEVEGFKIERRSGCVRGKVMVL